MTRDLGFVKTTLDVKKHADLSIVEEAAKRLGLRTVWVDRRAGRQGGGATPPAEATPDLTVPDMASLEALAALG